ncbi:glucan 4-alpha-glucosidase [Ophiostoma piceae UAMH 11346]|uniref:Glucan 4-alpha-glucosidase n=1 Tax=Ophiostoma piceae (strain UAMH 11346) TaxID=1262450 RepID=S3D8F8_OPHP1|nr:glucan 4-alpha-glucosidase [Ophiostoma piceae UAMH 11346]
MSSSNTSTSDDDDSSSDLSDSTCKVVPTKSQDTPTADAPTTPINNNSNPGAGQTPKTAPAASGPAANRPRRLSQSQKIQPTLLTDFFLGRPSPARVGAHRKRVSEVAAVKAEMRTAMRQAAVQKLQPPGGVKDRVKAWQKSNADAIITGNPESVPSEPTDVASWTDGHSVTEEDRLRIRARHARQAQEAKLAKSPLGRTEYPKTDGEDNGARSTQKARSNHKARAKSSGDNDHTQSKPDSDSANSGSPKGAKPKYYTTRITKPRRAVLNAQKDINAFVTGSPPKKRIVSDEHWMKRRNSKLSPKGRNFKKPAPAPTPAPGGVVGTGKPLPKDFLQRTAQNPTVQNKIKDWATRVEPPSPSKPVTPETRRGKTQYTTSGGESDVTKKPSPTSWRSAPNDATRARPIRSTKSAETDQPPQRRRSPRTYNRKPSQQPDDGIRIKPLRPDASTDSLNTSNVTSQNSSNTYDDGIRVRPLKLSTPNRGRRSPPRRKSSVGSNSTDRTVSNVHAKPKSQTTYTVRSAPTVTTATTATTEVTESSLGSKTSLAEDQESALETPTKKPARRSSARSKRPMRKRSPSPTETRSDEITARTASWHEDSASPSSLSSEDAKDESVADSYGPSTIPPKSLADIPVGYSAFSVLDLPARGSAPKERPKAARTPSFKGVPQILKKVVSEGKKIVHDIKIEPARPTVNQPPSIENWLDSTVDPFVESKTARKVSTRKVSSPQPKQPAETQPKRTPRTRSTSETRKRSDEPSPTRAPKDAPPARSQGASTTPSGARSQGASTTPSGARSQGASTTPSGYKSEPERRTSVSIPRSGSATPPAKQPSPSPATTPTTPTQKTAATSSLKRTGATRSNSSPLKSASARKPFKDLLRDAFRGESTAHKPPAAYPNYEAERERDRCRGVESEDSYDESLDKRPSHRRSSSGSSKGYTTTEVTESAVASGLTESSDASSSYVSSLSDSTGYPRHRPPPTNGDHELSTIVSVASYSTHPSDTMSTISQSTVTHYNSGDPSRDNGQKSSSGLKRRLTKHSDLVSVLSLPEDSQLPARTRSIKLARSLHRKTSKLDNATMDDLLREFSEDENTYRRELKTLVSGVIPVLLSQFVDQHDARRAADIFGADIASRKVDVMSRAVVNMGMALEKLSLMHDFIPIHSAKRMVDWLENVYPIYDNYLDVWRLGFQGIIVNLAPAAGKLPEEDSLVNGMERNEDGDILDENGERVDVAYLLRRPLVRIKWMLKFAKGAHIILGRHVAGDIEGRLDALHEKARRRNREETARKTDEDACATDTTRARDPRNLAIIENTSIDQHRQVSAKDWFDLSLSHSNGQRLDCQVELIFRDRINDPSDSGDVLIRETGSGGRSWLLFPPFSTSQLSARRGRDDQSLIIMVRGLHNGREWYELISIVADQVEAAEDWLDILGSSPMPPSNSGRFSMSTRRNEETDVPVGERKYNAHADTGLPESPKTPKTPSRYHKQHQRTTSTPVSPSPLSVGYQTPTQTDNSGRPSSSSPSSRDRSMSHPLHDDMRPDPLQLKKTPKASAAQEDGPPPPPPAHRTPITKSPPILSPPEDATPSARIRRRTSSPLKHECHPSDISSESDSSTLSSHSESESESSSDELEEDDVPDTLPGISIKHSELGMEESVVSENSLTPSNSASQAGLPGLRASYPSEYDLQLMASISYWSNKKGQWKELGEPLSAIVITPGLIEAYLPGANITTSAHSPKFNNMEVQLESGATRPLIALDLTPLVMIRQSTIVDLEIRSPVRSHSKYSHLDANIFRFRAQSPAELINLYTAVHESRMNNAKFKALEDEARFRSFGQPQNNNAEQGDDTSSHRRRSWFGRKNSYRASARAPSQSQGSSSSISATSFLRKLTGGGNTPFNIIGSSVDRQSGASFYTSGSSSAEGGGGGSSGRGSGRAGFSFSVPRSPSISLAESSNRGVQALGSSNIKMRCHLQLTPTKWEDRGNCLLTIARPPPGVRQELTIYHGLEKRVLVVSIPKKTTDKPLVVVDVVVGSACFSRLAARGIVLNVWEEMRDDQNRVGTVAATGAISGHVRKWCFQFSSAAVATWVFGLVGSEVQIG